MDHEKIENLMGPAVQRFQELEGLLSAPGIHSNPDFAALAREHRVLSNRIERMNEWKKVQKELAHVAEMLRSGDPEMVELAEGEKQNLQERAATLEVEIAD